MKKVIYILIIVISIPIIFVNGVILIDLLIHPKEIPSFFGYKPFVVLSRTMESEICHGDIAVVKETKPDELKAKDIVAVKIDKYVMIQRIIEVKENGKEFITKSDKNNYDDTQQINSNNIEGKYVYKISNAGNFIVKLQTPFGIIISLSIPIILFVLIEVMENKSNKELLEEEQDENERLKTKK